MRFARLPFIIPLLALLFAQVGSSQNVPSEWLTYYEQSGYLKTPRYDETLEYLRKLEASSPWIKLSVFGKTPQGRDLVLVAASKDPVFQPSQESEKPTLLIQNGIHAGEIDGKDACLMLLRDIAITKTKAALLDRVNLLIIPVLNVDGHERFGPYNRINQNGPEETGWRVTAQYLNLNRDYMKIDSPELKAWMSVFHSWKPDFFIDCHVTDGADFQYIVSYSIESHENVAQPLRDWIRGSYVPTLSKRMEDRGTPIVPYVFFVDDKNPSKGLWGGTAPPRFSTVYSALCNRPGLLVETHMLKEYRKRVDGTYQIIEETLKRLNEEGQSLKEAIRLSDRQTAAALESPFALQYEVHEVANDTIAFRGFRSRVEKSALSGGDRIVYTREPFEEKIPRFDSLRATASVRPPFAYLVPREWQEIISRLAIHGLTLEELSRESTFEVEQYLFTDPSWQQLPFEGRHPVHYTATARSSRVSYPEGTVVVRLNQPLARVALHLLEPAAPDAFVAWGFFDAIFEQKEYAEDYVMEKVAREMIDQNPPLRSAFEARVQFDTAFASSPRARLNFFYERSPYWDQAKNVYPIARMISETPLPTRPYSNSPQLIK